MVAMAMATAYTTRGNTVEARAAGSSVPVLWDPATGRFDAVRLRRAMVLRAWTPNEFAREAGCGRTSIYKAMTGYGVRDSTAIKILSALQRCQPRLSNID